MGTQRIRGVSGGEIFFIEDSSSINKLQIVQNESPRVPYQVKKI